MFYCDSAKGKIFKDITSGVNKLVRLGINNNASVISFLNFDPDFEEIVKCEAYCQARSCTFEYYTNYDISELLKNGHQDLRLKYLNLSIEDESIKLVVNDSTLNSFNSIDVFVNDIYWMKGEEQLNTAALLKEFVCNSFSHGNANYVELTVRSRRLTYIDDGEIFNFLDYMDTGQGGKFTLLKYTSTYLEFPLRYRRTDQGTNVYTLINNKPKPFILEVKEDCSLTIDNWRRSDEHNVQGVNVPKHCNTITIILNQSFFMMSNVIPLANTINKYLDKDIHVELIIPKQRASMFDEWIEDWSNKRQYYYI